MLEIKGAVAVITGGSAGIGACLARQWVKNGGKVVLAGRDPEKLSRMEKEIGEMGGDVATIVCHVTKEEDNQALAQLAVDKFGAINLIAPFAGITKDGLLLAPDCGCISQYYIKIRHNVSGNYP